MAKILKISTPKGNVVEVLEEVLTLAREGNIKNITLAAEVTDTDTVITGYANVDAQEKQYLVSHIQSDIVIDIVKENLC